MIGREIYLIFFRVNSKIAEDIKKPFKLEGITRVDDTTIHKAIREYLNHSGLSKTNDIANVIGLSVFRTLTFKRDVGH